MLRRRNGLQFSVSDLLEVRELVQASTGLHEAVSALPDSAAATLPPELLDANARLGRALQTLHTKAAPTPDTTAPATKTADAVPHV